MTREAAQATGEAPATLPIRRGPGSPPKTVFTEPKKPRRDLRRTGEAGKAVAQVISGFRSPIGMVSFPALWQSSRVQEPDVPLPPLDSADVGPVQIRPLGQSLLRKFQREPLLPNRFTEL